MSWLWGLFGGKKQHIPSDEAFQGILKYNTVFVTDDNLEKLTCRGFGARRLRKVTYAAAYIPRNEEETPAKDGIVDDEEGGDDHIKAHSRGTDKTVTESEPPVKKAKTPTHRVDLDNDKSPMILFDEEAFYLFRANLLELQHEDGTTVTLQELWDKFLEKNPKFPVKYKVYSYFREQNFVVKTGVHYGLDYAVYRTLPTHCHSEMCALVVDGTERMDVSEGLNSVAAESQISWRHVSCMTRVMPDVMKLLLFCHVLPDATDKLAEARAKGAAVSNESVIDDIFGTALSSSTSGSGSVCVRIDYSTPECLNALTVHPTTCLVRRLPCKGENYDTIGDIQMRYRNCSILKRPRVEQVTKKKRRKRRDHTEVRIKTASKHNKIWSQLIVMEPGKKTSSKKEKNAAGAARKIGSEEGSSNMSKSAERRALKRDKEERKEKSKQQDEARTKSIAAADQAVKTAAASSGDPMDIIAQMNARLAAAKASAAPAPAAAAPAAAPAPAAPPAPAAAPETVTSASASAQAPASASAPAPASAPASSAVAPVPAESALVPSKRDTPKKRACEQALVDIAPPAAVAPRRSSRLRG